jgi:hypothetical protein
MKNAQLFSLTLGAMLLFTASGCRKTDEGSKLPPFTEIGANTFGCLVNGVAYIPKGFGGTGAPNPKLSIQTFNGKLILSISSNRFKNGNSVGYVDISISNSVLMPGTYAYPSKMNFSIGWAEVLGNCFTPAFDTTVKKQGEVFITKFDEASRIVSGRFNCKFKPNNCDTVFVSDGRFDLKF